MLELPKVLVLTHGTTTPGIVVTALMIMRADGKALWKRIVPVLSSPTPPF